jgi:hypothetical protein
MTLDKLFLKNGQAKWNQRTPKRVPSKTRQQIDAILRDTAFVLKMTQQVRAEIDLAQTAQETVTV